MVMEGAAAVELVVVGLAATEERWRLAESAALMGGLAAVGPAENRTSLPPQRDRHQEGEAQRETQMGWQGVMVK